MDDPDSDRKYSFLYNEYRKMLTQPEIKNPEKSESNNSKTKNANLITGKDKKPNQ